MRAHRRLKKQKARQARYADKSARDVDFKVGDPVFLKNHKKTCKLSPSWEPYYRIIEKKAPRTFRVKNQLTGEVVTSHAEHLILAKTEWEPSPNPPADHRRTRLRNVVSDEDPISSSENETSTFGTMVGRRGSDEQIEEPDKKIEPDIEAGDGEKEQSDNRIGFHKENASVDMSDPHENGYVLEDPDAEDTQIMKSNDEYLSMSDELQTVEEDMELPNELIRPLKRQREGTSSEDDIPLSELRKRLKIKRTRQKEVDTLKYMRLKPSYYLWGTSMSS